MKETNVKENDLTKESNEEKIEKKSKLQALIDAKKNGTSVPVPRKGKGQSSLDSTTVFGSKAVRKVNKGGSHNAK